MSEIIQTIKKTVEKMGRVPDQLRSILARHSDRGNIPTAGSKENQDRLLAYARVRAGQLAKQLRSPIVCVLNNTTQWFDESGIEVSDPVEVESLQMLSAKGELKTFSQETLDSIVRRAAEELVQITKQPVKINTVWFDRQGDLVGKDDYDRFESTFGPPATEQDNVVKTV